MSFNKAKLVRILNTVLWVLIDAALCNAAMILAQQFRFDTSIPEIFFSTIC